MIESVMTDWTSSIPIPIFGGLVSLGLGLVHKIRKASYTQLCLAGAKLDTIWDHVPKGGRGAYWVLM